MHASATGGARPIPPREFGPATSCQRPLSPSGRVTLERGAAEPPQTSVGLPHRGAKRLGTSRCQLCTECSFYTFCTYLTSCCSATVSPVHSSRSIFAPPWNSITNDPQDAPGAEHDDAAAFNSPPIVPGTYFAACASIDQDPTELMAKALGDEITPEIRRPRIVSAAWKRINTPGVGLGEERLQELEASRRLDRQEIRILLRQELNRAARDELPVVLGLYASALRFEGDLSRAALVFREGIRMAKELDALAAEAHLLIRMAYLALEWQNPAAALRHAQEGTLAYACLGEVERTSTEQPRKYRDCVIWSRWPLRIGMSKTRSHA